MSPLALFLIIIVIAVAIFGGIALAGYLGGSGRAEARREREDRIQAERALTISRERERIGSKALRAIANGAGNPIFEASDALEQIEGTYTKELN